MRHPELHQRVCALTPLPEAEWLKVEALAREVAVARREHFARPGDSSERFGLVVKGVFRAYRLTDEGEETVKAFRAEGELIGAYAELLQRIPSRTFIQSLEPSRVLVFRMADIERLEQEHPCWSRLLRRVAEWHFLLKERREQEFLDLSAGERLERFLAEHPHLQARIPQR